jgi:hypothetical protein
LRSSPEVLACCAWTVATWLVFAVLSNNYSGWCVSIRWFVPLLAAGYFLLALLLRERPGLGADFLALSFWGAVLGGLMWQVGTWYGTIPHFWEVQVAALASWLGLGRALPPRADRWTRALATPLWLLLGAAALTVLLAGPGRVSLPEPDSSTRAEVAWAVTYVLLGLVLGARARADARPWLTLALTLLVATLFVAFRPLQDLRGLAWLAVTWLVLWALSRAAVARGGGRSR